MCNKRCMFPPKRYLKKVSICTNLFVISVSIGGEINCPLPLQLKNDAKSCINKCYRTELDAGATNYR